MMYDLKEIDNVLKAYKEAIYVILAIFLTLGL